jgi:hypothetical protein
LRKWIKKWLEPLLSKKSILGLLVWAVLLILSIPLWLSPLAKAIRRRYKGIDRREKKRHSKT